jgi:putative exosortase-associated protein (TIGR04073 family)
MRKYFGICALVLAFILATGVFSTLPASAEELYRESAEVNSMMTKLGRGLVNVLTGWLEVPKQIAKSIRETDPASGTCIGLCKGVAWTWARTMTGVYEVVTFPVPTPKNYEAIIEPEFILKSMWGDPIPYVSDKPDWRQPAVQNY